MMSTNSLGEKPFYTLVRIARYFIDFEHCPRKVIKVKLQTFVLQCNPQSSMPKWSDIIDSAITYAYKYRAVELDAIEITRSEIDTIMALEGRQVKRLAFTLLCLAKYYNSVNDTDSGWVNSKDSEIMKMANISTSLKRQAAMYSTLVHKDLLDTSAKVDNTNVRVKYIGDDTNDVVLRITDFRNLGYQFLKYIGEPYFVCENCGITSKLKSPNAGRKQKYCTDCARKIHIQKTINPVMSKKLYRR